MANVIRTVIQFRRATTEQWQAYSHVVPAAGEPCFDITAKTLKIGDGSTSYGDLPIIGGSGSSVAPDGKTIILEDGVFKLMGFEAADVGAQLTKNADGDLEWVVPSTEVVDNLKSDVSTLQNAVDTLRSDVDSMQTILTPEDDSVLPLLARVENLETDVDTLESDMDTLNSTIEDTIQKAVTKEVTAQIDDFATKISDDEKVNTFKELVDYVANHGGEVATIVADITDLQNKVGEDTVENQINNAINNGGYVTSEKIAPIESAIAKMEKAAQYVKYEIAHYPSGAIIDYREKEIRVLCPSGTPWALQNSGENSDPSMYYIGFKAYAPSDDVVSFKEDLTEIIADNTMYYFENNEFAGTDEFGRKYSIVWLPAARYDADTDSWTYYGDASSNDRYIGWYYSVEWYASNGKKVASDTIRINLSNEDCHGNIEPYYMSNVVREISVNGTVQDVIDGKVNISIDGTLGVKASEEVTIAEDGTLGIGKISISKIVQEDEDSVVFDGGGAEG